MTDPRLIESRETGLVVLFEEVNEHLRATETKHLQIAIGYLGVLALSLSIVATPNQDATGDSIVFISWSHLLVMFVLIAVGVLVVFALDSYRLWKQHYKLIARILAEELEIAEFGPYWILRSPYDRLRIGPWHIPVVSADNVWTYFIAISTIVLSGVCSYMFLTLTGKWWLPVLGTVIFNALLSALFLSLRRRAMRRPQTLRDGLAAALQQYRHERAGMEGHRPSPTGERMSDAGMVR